MSIRKLDPYKPVQIPRGLKDVLYRNGVKADIVYTPEGYKLLVLGHDSPQLTFDISEQQVHDMMLWGEGSTYGDKKAYNTFLEITGSHFDRASLPRTLAEAKNAGGMVNLTPYKYKAVMVDPYPITGRGVLTRPTPPRGAHYNAPLVFNARRRGWGGDYVSWSPLQRFVNNILHPFRPAPRVMVVENRPDGRTKPGELPMRDRPAGFYYKGQPQQQSQDVLDSLAINIQNARSEQDVPLEVCQPIETVPRPTEPAIPYSKAITSDVYFTKNAWMDVLSSHGIVIDEDSKTMTIQSSQARFDKQYTLTDEQLRKLTANSLSGKDGVSLDTRIATINGIIGQHFVGTVSKSLLEKDTIVSLDLTPEELMYENQLIAEREQMKAAQRQAIDLEIAKGKVADENERIRLDPNAVNGRDIQAVMGNRGFFQPVKNGREMTVGEIRVEKMPDKKEDIMSWEEYRARIPDYDKMSSDEKTAARKVYDHTASFAERNLGKYMMTATINAQLVSHTISAKDYQKFLDLDDKHRLTMFDKVFSEVKIKSAGGRDLTGDDMYLSEDGRKIISQQDASVAHAASRSVDGATLQELNSKKGFYRERADGREVDVREIRVEPTQDGKFKMTAVINGEAITHEITQKEYDKFLAVDDYQRMRLFSKIFDEVDMKTRPGQGVNIGAAILAAIVATGDLVAGMAMRPIGHRAAPEPEFYREDMGPVFYKPGVVSPMDVAEARYRSMEAELESAQNQGIGRGI